MLIVESVALVEAVRELSALLGKIFASRLARTSKELSIIFVVQKIVSRAPESASLLRTATA
jgi:hypothetical protein